jgi:hypothetical protein
MMRGAEAERLWIFTKSVTVEASARLDLWLCTPESFT